MKVVENDNMIKLIADDGKRITNAERSIFVEVIYLPVTANKDNYAEVGREIWKHFVQEENPDVVELQAQNIDINETMDVLMMALANSDEQNSTAIDAIMIAIDDLYRMLEPLINGGGE